ncbi:MAG TPA: hypothetical protein VFG14_10165 [Chthoniobacteraceae bacterium]|nr:hypothetical protein [Chthoniobacteraceae bacterium]
MQQRDADLLAESQASRRRAWVALRRIRNLLCNAAVVKIEPVVQPPTFETEGLVLAKGLEQTFRRIQMTVNELEAAIEAMRPYMRSVGGEGFPQAHLRLNRAISAARELLPVLPGLR